MKQYHHKIKQCIKLFTSALHVHNCVFLLYLYLYNIHLNKYLTSTIAYKLNLPNLRTTNVHKRNWFHIADVKQTASHRNHDNAHYANDRVLLANTPAKAESILHSLKQATRCIGLILNVDKTEFMCFKQDRAISTLNGKPLKLIDLFTYLGSNISSTESDVNI